MRADRLLSILLLLQARGRITAQQLAEEHEVSVRTIYRDIDALSTAGVPVYAERGPGGGCALVEGYRTSLTGLTKDEVRALFMLGIPASLDELGLSQELRTALRKLAAALPGSDGLPAAVQALPAKGRVAGSEGYARESYLGLSDMKNCIIFFPV